MRSILGACLLTASFAAHAWADGGPKKGSDADDAFMTGIRKLGVMSGEAFECSDVVDQPKIGQAVIDLATQVICISDCRLRSFIVARSAMEWDTTSITRPARRRSRTSKRFKPSIWSTDMGKGSTFIFATMLASAGGADAAPTMPFISTLSMQGIERPAQSGEGGIFLCRAAGGGWRRRSARRWWPARANRGGFDSNNFHRDASNTRNRNTATNRNVSANSNRNANITANRNVNVNGSGGCCYGDYNGGPSWGGVAAGVAAGAVLGAAVNSAANTPTYAAPPPTYPPGYVSPPPY